jgi:hypothetical protein
LYLLYICHPVIHRELQNVVYMKKKSMFKKKGEGAVHKYLWFEYIVYILIKIIINNKCIQVSHLRKAPRDGTKWRFIPTCAWCRIDIWKICNRHQGTILLNAA